MRVANIKNPHSFKFIFYKHFMRLHQFCAGRIAPFIFYSEIIREYNNRHRRPTDDRLFLPFTVLKHTCCFPIQ